MNESAEKILGIIASEGHYVSTSVGFSMKPMLRSRRDTIVISPKPPELKKYDVVLYSSGDRLILHRIVKVLPDGCDIRGDNCFFTEYGIKNEQIVGVLAEFWRGEKKISAESFSYKLYSRVWVTSYPLRKFLRRVRNFSGRIFRKLFRRRIKNK
ncbi:MAG: S24/S26 family peptidase [Clostridia bacterium]|nr:S24/S26 family peptidase [Clostridia bacterium]